MPRKIAGSAMITIDALTVAASIPSVVLDSATHLYFPPRRPCPPPDLATVDSLTPLAPRSRT